MKGSKSINYYRLLISTASVLFGIDCSASKETETAFRSQSRTGSGSDSEDSTSGLSCTLVNQTRACSCGTLPGRQTCLGSEWSQCECFSDDASLVTGPGGQLYGDSSVGSTTPEGNRRQDIEFDWLRTTPMQGECKPGIYEGSFECPFALGGMPPADPPLMVKGPISMTLEKSSKGEFLEIVDGNLEGFADIFSVPFTSKLEGQLDCMTNSLEALAIDGTYTGFMMPPGTFSGDLKADYNRITLQLSGEWNLLEPMSGTTCTGPWTANFVSP